MALLISLCGLVVLVGGLLLAERKKWKRTKSAFEIVALVWPF